MKNGAAYNRRNLRFGENQYNQKDRTIRSPPRSSPNTDAQNRTPVQVTQNAVFSPQMCWLPDCRWGTGVGGVFRVPGLTTFLVAEGWALSQIQCRCRSLFRMRSLGPAPEDWLGRPGVEAQVVQPAMVPPGYDGILCLQEHLGLSCGSENDLYLKPKHLSLHPDAAVCNSVLPLALAGSREISHGGGTYTPATGKPHPSRPLFPSERQLSSTPL